MDKKVKLFSNCIPVKGVSRAVICDMQLQTIHYIPDSLYDLIIEHFGKSPNEIKKAYDHQYDAIIDEYLSFLEEKNCIFYTDFPEKFSDIDLKWEYPYPISNAIIDRDHTSSYDIFKVLKQLDELYCKSVQLRFFDEVQKSYIIEVLDFLNYEESILSSIEIYVPHSDWTAIVNVSNVFKEYLRVSQICVYSASKNEISDINNDGRLLMYTDQEINSEKHCGAISMDYFSVNLKTFTESQKFNSCLNRKISVDSKGEIKNCPSMEISYGNIENTSLKKALEHPNFKNHWSITKDQVTICKNCEFRYVCTDCRAYVENPEDEYSKPLKCGYDPYTNNWEKWSTNPLKEKAVLYYEMPEIIKK
ncbi:grasp-with-spasm system SPASM domain peptide maturase [Aquimarina sp. 2201CG1-2-11]|uniref:grasp-with-spasm system SPASM domain peptide maturase n=1 Tax=Aquimarina discodermiae TaxID=3231043 RepID=UPI003462C6AC